LPSSERQSKPRAGDTTRSMRRSLPLLKSLTPADEPIAESSLRRVARRNDQGQAPGRRQTRGYGRQARTAGRDRRVEAGLRQ
jgi:hypothetical protein